MAFWFNSLYLTQITDYCVYLLVDAVQLIWNFYILLEFQTFQIFFSQMITNFKKWFLIYCFFLPFLSDEKMTFEKANCA